ncbi:MAG: NUDIX hydrolase [Enterococcus sp.]
MEMMDVYTAQKERCKKTHLRDLPMKVNEYRMVVSVLVFNSKGELLIQQRSSNKYSWPNFWDYSAKGAVEATERPYQAAERELFEELGITVSLKAVPSRLTVRFEEGWDEIYFVEKDVAIAKIRLQESEVQAVRWVSEEAYLTLIDEGEFIPYIYGKSIFDFYRSSDEHF